MTIKSFTDLHVWQKAHQLVIDIYKITRFFPKEEIYGLTNQIRRSAISITSNIAEGFSRRGAKEKRQFYYMAAGSISELQNQLLVARDVGYLKQNEFSKLAQQSVEVRKMLNRLITTTKS